MRSYARVHQLIKEEYQELKCHANGRALPVFSIQVRPTLSTSSKRLPREAAR